MPTQRGALRLQGKDRSDGKVYWHGKDGKYHVRQGQKPGIHKDQPELKANFTTIAEKNLLAGTVSRLMKTYAPHDCERELYQKLRQTLQKDPVQGRYFQLKRFEKAEGHTGKKLIEEMMLPAFRVVVKKDQLVVSFDIEKHPQRRPKRDHYFMRMILALWNNTDDQHSRQAQRIQWIRMDAALPLSYDLVFDKPKDSREYLLLCCLERGEEPAEARLGTDKLIHIAEVGSFSKADRDAYEAYLAERRKPKESIRENLQEEKAVAPVVRRKGVELRGKTPVKPKAKRE